MFRHAMRLLFLLAAFFILERRISQAISHGVTITNISWLFDG